jgi:hypothetical protein
MPRVNRFYALPLAVQLEVEAKLMANGFSGYIELQDDLRRRGHRISKSALQRVGAKLKAAVKADPAKRFSLQEPTQ